MDENKQIEEIAKDLCPLYEKYKSCKTCDAVLGVGEEPCVYKCMAELITTKGYRKQSEGEWLVSKTEQAWNNAEYPIERNCSVCGMRRNIETQYAWNYCPNCGAKMKGE